MSDDATPKPLAVGSSALFAFESLWRLLLGFIGFWLLLGLKFILLALRVLRIPNVLNDIVEMGDILSNQKPRQGIASGSVGLVCGNSSDDLNAIGSVRVGHGSAADAVDGNAINQIGFPVILSGRDVPAKEAERPRLDCGEPHPSHLTTNADLPLTWEQWYKLLWEWKIALLKKNDGRISFPISKDDPLSLLQK